MSGWHIVTGEYPPQPGGVSDYTRAVARGLVAAGDGVTVWAPACQGAEAADAGIEVRRLPGRFGRAALRQLTSQLDREPAPRRILVQYVPHAFGWKAMNLPFCWWLRSRTQDSVWVMFHEVAFPTGGHQTLAENVVGVVTRRMAAIVAGAAERTFVSIPAWGPMLRAAAGASPRAEWLPVPSAIPVVEGRRAIADVRARLAGSRPLVGHFGTYGRLTLPLLEAALGRILSTSDCHIALLGRASDAVARAFSESHPDARARLHGTGELAASDVSVHLSACDVLLQPYPDGISSRRTSAMAALAHGRALATTEGTLTEPIWSESGAVLLTPAGDAAMLAASVAGLLHDPERAARLGEAGRRLYDSRFDIRHTIRALTRAPGAARVA